jgi:hypothetical protein
MEYVIAALMFSAVSVAAYLQQKVTLLRYIDSEQYFQLANRFHWHKTIQADVPMVYRILTPWLASFASDSAIDHGIPFYIINIASALVITLLMVAWLRSFVGSRAIRLLAIAAFLVEWHAPARFVYFMPMYVDPLFMACLLLSLVWIERTRERPLHAVAPVVAGLAFIGTLDREVMAIVPLVFVLARGTRALRPAGWLWLAFPIAASAAAVMLTHAIVTPNELHSSLEAPLKMLATKPVYTWVLGWFFTFGPAVIAVIAVNGADTFRWLRDRPDLAFLLVSVGVLGYVGGTDTERILVWAFPVVYAAFGRAVERHRGVLGRPGIAALLVAIQAVSARVFWSVPPTYYNPGSFADLPSLSARVHAALNRTIVMDSEYGNLWSYWGSRPWHLLLLTYDVLLVMALVWWIRRSNIKTLLSER